MHTAHSPLREHSDAHRSAAILGDEFTDYLKKLTRAARAISKQLSPPFTREEGNTTGSVTEPEAQVQLIPGEFIYVRSFVRRWNAPRFHGPYEVVFCTPTAVKVKGLKYWIHLTDVRRAYNNVQEEVDEGAQTTANKANEKNE